MVERTSTPCARHKAAIAGNADIAIGNVVGSNIFNILAILGLNRVIAPGGVPVNPESQALDMPFMVAVVRSLKDRR